MKNKKRILAFVLASLMLFGCVFEGCDKKAASTSTTTSSDEANQSANLTSQDTSTSTSTSTTERKEPVKPSGDYIKVGINVYYNDADSSYYEAETGEYIYITEPGQYTLSFDCETDLSDKAKAAGVKYLKNLTAIYLLDLGVAEGEQSPLKACNIFYDKIVVNDTELTITQEAPKSAFKGSGVFDTNDPVNAWDGSQIAEVSAGSDHVANFNSIDNPTKISITFTLSDFSWNEEEKTEASPVTSENGYINTAKFSDVDFSAMNALEFSKYLGNGINLGNTMEACNRASLGTLARVTQYETCWGQPVTTAEMIQGMKNCGFDTIRIPVAWTNTMNYEGGDLTFDTAYLDRVEEIVNYALDAEMFVVVNDHWDGGWWEMFGSADESERKLAMDIYTSIWTTVCERFKDYSDMLILESANEELGNSLNTSGKLTTEECYEITNTINQKFVDIVRNSGGNNANRFLLIAGYNTNFDQTLDSKYKMPKDTADGKLLLSVHYYDPWNYCGAEQQSRWGLKSEYEYMDNQFKKMTAFTDKGYGIIIGEYGALPVYNDGDPIPKENTIAYTKRLLDNCDIYNYVPLLWSTGDSFNKRTMTMIMDEMTALFTSRCYAEEIKKGDTYLDDVKIEMAEDLAGAIEMWDGVETYEAGTPVAWIMWNGGAGTYSVGDTFNPADNTEGITATTAIVDGAGEYTVGLEFAGGNTGLTFAALAIADAELLYPGCKIDIKSIKFDDTEIALTALPYTSSDNGITTRVNLVNEWVNKLPDDARLVKGTASMAKPVIFDKSLLDGTKKITITFELILP